MSMTENEVKTFDLSTVLSLTTGVLLSHGGFGQMHELAEFVSGRPIWTHQFASEQLWTELTEAVFVQQPWVRAVSDSFPHDAMEITDKDERLAAIFAWRDQQEHAHPEGVSLVGGQDGRTYENLALAAIAQLDQMAGTRPVIVVRDGEVSA